MHPHSVYALSLQSADGLSSHRLLELRGNHQSIDSIYQVAPTGRVLSYWDPVSHSLHVRDLLGKELRVERATSAGRFSPDGRYLAIAVRTRTAHVDITLLDVSVEPIVRRTLGTLPDALALTWYSQGLLVQHSIVVGLAGVAGGQALTVFPLAGAPRTVARVRSHIDCIASTARATHVFYFTRNGVYSVDLALVPSTPARIAARTAAPVLAAEAAPTAASVLYLTRKGLFMLDSSGTSSSIDTDSRIHSFAFSADGSHILSASRQRAIVREGERTWAVGYSLRRLWARPPEHCKRAASSNGSVCACCASRRAEDPLLRLIVGEHMPWQLLRHTPTPTPAVAHVISASTWILRGPGHLFTWCEESTRPSWDITLDNNELIGQRFLVLCGDVVVIASYNGDNISTEFFGVHSQTGKILWSHDCEFKPVSGPGAAPMTSDAQGIVTCLGNDRDEQYCMLRLDAITGAVRERRQLGIPFDTTVSLGENVFIGGRHGFYLVNDSDLSLVAKGEVLELRQAHDGCVVHIRNGLQHDLIWIDRTGRTAGRLKMGSDTGLLHLTPGSKRGSIIIMPSIQGGISLYDFISSKMIWSSGVEQNLKAKYGTCVDGVLLAFVDNGNNESRIRAYQEQTGIEISSPISGRVFVARILGGNGLFLVSFLRHVDTYRFVES